MARLDRLDAEGDGAMRLAHARRAEQHDVLGALDEAQAGELADLLAADRGLNVEVGLIQALEPGQRGQLEAALDAALVPPAPLGLQSVGEEPLVVEIALGGVLADTVELGQEVLHLHPPEEDNIVVQLLQDRFFVSIGIYLNQVRLSPIALNEIVKCDLGHADPGYPVIFRGQPILHNRIRRP